MFCTTAEFNPAATAYPSFRTPLCAEFAAFGADVAIITAASSSAESIELAANISRDRARIVVVDTVDLGVSRKLMYMKELSLVLSRSYGPGRYDPNYEEEVWTIHHLPERKLYHGRFAANIGMCGCFSFFPSKTLGGVGDGG